MKKKPIVFFDLETTGKSKNPNHIRILEICLIKIDPYTLEQIGESYYRKCNNDGVPIEPDATKRNNITEDDVKDCKPFSVYAKEVYDFLDGCDIGGHYCSVFDIPILYYSLLREGLTWDYKNTNVYDTFTLWRKYYSNKLGDIYKRFTGEDLENAHTADADTMANVVVYKELRKRDGDFDDDELDYFKDYLDICRNFKIVTTENGEKNIVVNFGKYKDKPISEVDKSYFEWMLDQDFPPDTLYYAKKIYNMK